jgi:Domain of unknown function (DUF4326)
MDFINIKTGQPFTHYAGRDCGRHKNIGLGNPFIVGKHGHRGECIKLFEQLLTANFVDCQRMIGEGNDMHGILRMSKLLGFSVEELEFLQHDLLEAIRQLPPNAVLGCWCKPAPCHCESIIKRKEP